MAATEVEDLAALVGIEILPDSVNEAQTVTNHSKETVQQDASVHEVETNTTVIHKSESEVVPSAEEDDLAEKLSALEEEFGHRYTSEDAEFMSTLSTPSLPPPCIAPWWSNNRGQDRSRGDRGRGWNRGQGRGRGHHFDNRQFRDRRDDSYSRSQGHPSYNYHHHDNRRDHYQDRRDYYQDREPQRHGYRDRSPVHHRDRY